MVNSGDDGVNHLADDVNLRVNLARLKIVGGLDVELGQHGFFAEIHRLEQDDGHRHDQHDAGAFADDAGVFRRQAEDAAGQR